jgi:hypothetical protein
MTIIDFSTNLPTAYKSFGQASASSNLHLRIINIVEQIYLAKVVSKNFTEMCG